MYPEASSNAEPPTSERTTLPQLGAVTLLGTALIKPDTWIFVKDFTGGFR
jgi:hypothetical protein